MSCLLRVTSIVPLVLLPLLAFYVSVSVETLEPRWPEAEASGWTSCVSTTAEAWWPLVLWASLAMLAHAGAGLEGRWIRAGHLAGCLAAGFLTVAAYGFWSVHESGRESYLLWLPGGTFLAHAIAFGVACRGSRPSALEAALTSIACACAGAANVGAAMARFERLAYQTPPNDCFVVTAAARGHARVVRPIAWEWRRGILVPVNEQLRALRRFEARWREASPRSHSIMRRIYGVVGPVIASRLTSPWSCDVMYLALKPVEILARVAVAARTR